MIAIVWFKYLAKLPRFLLLVLVDLVYYIKNKGWLEFNGWGISLFVGEFGGGKTSSAVHYAYSTAKKYPQVTIMGNLTLRNFPTHTNVVTIKTAADILDAPDNTLVLLDEVGTISNSRDFMQGTSVPKFLFQFMCQCRKRHLVIYGTTKRWKFVDKQIRDIAKAVHVVRSHFQHPFTRICGVYSYDAQDYEEAYTNPNAKLACKGFDVYVQDDFLRGLYDTNELVSSILAAEYASAEEIMAGRGDSSAFLVETSKKRRGKKTSTIF